MAQPRLCDERDEAEAAFYGGKRVVVETPGGPPAPTLAETLCELLGRSWTAQEMEEARVPWPHAFQEREVGLFPVGEVTVLASAGREGKTTVLVGVCAAMIAGHRLGGMRPLPSRSVIVYSAEDSRAQYARKVAAQMAQWPEETEPSLMRHLLVVDLDAPGVEAARSLVMVLAGVPMPSGTVEAIVEAVGPLLGSPTPPGLMVFETASTLSEADETNVGFRVLIQALRRIARALQLPVVLSHHVSQASLANLADLNLSTADIRGGTALVNNARQTALLVNLGSDGEPFPDTDARTLLRRLACLAVADRVTALVCLDSSKGVTPPPMFFRWVNTDWGPAAVEIEPPDRLLGRPWRKLLEMVRAERGEMREEAKAERKAATERAHMQQVVDIVARLEREGADPPITARRVRDLAGMSHATSKAALTAALSEGHLRIGTGGGRGKSVAVFQLAGRK